MDYVNSAQRRQDSPMVPAIAYVKWQCWDDIYEPCKALARGTLFAVLDLPFKGGCK